MAGGFAGGEEVALELDDGTAVLVATESDTTRVVLSGVSVDEAAIREGECASPGNLVHALTGDETEVETPLVDLLAGEFVLVAGDDCVEIPGPED